MTQAAGPHPIVEALVRLFVEQTRMLAKVRDTLGTAPLPTAAHDAVTDAAGQVDVRRAAVLAVANADVTVVEEPLHVAVHHLREALKALLVAFNPLGSVPDWASVVSWAIAHTGDVRRLHQRIIAAIEKPIVPHSGSPSAGFEYQLNYAKVETEGIPSKTVLKRWMGRGGAEILRLEVDGENVEFITVPVANQGDLDEQLDAIEQEAGVISAGGEGGVVYATPDPILSDDDGRVIRPAGTRVVVKHVGNVRGKIQATAGRRLDQLSAFLIRYGGGRFGRDTLDAIAGLGAVGNALPLLHLVNYYLGALEGGAPREAEGPKILLQAMSRTDFHSAYLLLNDDERVSFKDCIDYEGTRGTMNDLRARTVCPRGYLGPAGELYEGPTVGDWLDSIVLGDTSTEDTEPIDRDDDGEGPRGASRDLLSPPKGYPAHRRGRHFTYAMGRFGTAADGALLLEVRAIKKDMPYNVRDLRAQTTEFLASL